MLGQIVQLIRSRPYTSSLLLLTLLLLLSALHRPDPASTSYQYPGFLPARFSYLRLPANGDDRPVYPFPQLTREQERRYAHLRIPYVPGHNSRIPKPATHSAGAEEVKGKYLLVTLTRNIEQQLPDILNAMVVLTSFLGHDKVRFSFYEGPSDDATPKVLQEVLIPMLQRLGVPQADIIIRTNSPKAEWDKINRIQQLAALRNEAISPLWLKPEWKDTVAVVFFNDVFLRARDILELLHQHVKAGEKAGVETGMTTGIDWWKRHPAYFYDVWVARTMEGDLFYPMDSTTWTPSDQFLEGSGAQDPYKRLHPFQVFSSWNGMAVIAATPFLAPHHLRFRRSDLSSGECRAAEPEILCRDLWGLGMGRIQVVPSVQLAYERDVATDTAETLVKQMEELDWMQEIPREEEDHTVDWRSQPPEKVRCHEWPEKFGLDGNVWAETTWGEPYVGYAN